MFSAPQQPAGRGDEEHQDEHEGLDRGEDTERPQKSHNRQWKDDDISKCQYRLQHLRQRLPPRLRGNRRCLHGILFLPYAQHQLVCARRDNCNREQCEFHAAILRPHSDVAKWRHSSLVVPTNARARKVQPTSQVIKSNALAAACCSSPRQSNCGWALILRVLLPVVLLGGLSPDSGFAEQPTSPQCSMAPPFRELRFGARGFSWLEDDELSGRCDDVPADAWTRKRSGS